MNIRNKRKAGASIVEVLVALVLFATFLGGAVKVILSQQQLSDKARAHYTAINLAKNRIEYLRNMRRASYDQIGAMEETDTIVDEDGLNDDNGKFSRTTVIVDGPTTNLHEVTVTVKIKNPITLDFGNEQEVIQSYLAKLKER